LNPCAEQAGMESAMSAMERRTFLHGPAPVERESSGSGEWVRRGGDTPFASMDAGRAKSPPARGPAARRWRHPTGGRLAMGFSGGARRLP
jgi:hypothetical protein